MPVPCFGTSFPFYGRTSRNHNKNEGNKNNFYVDGEKLFYTFCKRILKIIKKQILALKIDKT